MAIWPILMNWQTISSTLLPAAQCVGAQLDLQDLTRRFLNTWNGYLLTAAVLIGAFLHLLHNSWKVGRSLVLSTWSTKCSIPEDSTQYDVLIGWISKHPASLAL